jgi:hypothetical protein
MNENENDKKKKTEENSMVSHDKGFVAKEQPKQENSVPEFWSNNPMHKDYTTEGDKKSWSFYLSHRGKPKEQSPGGQSSGGQSPKKQNSKEKDVWDEPPVPGIKGKDIPPFHGDVHGNSFAGTGGKNTKGNKNDDSGGENKNDEKNEDKEDNERQKAARDMCLSRYPGDVEAQKDYDEAAAKGKDPVKAVEEGAARRKAARAQEPQTQKPQTSANTDPKEIKMEVILGKPNTRGNSDVVDNFDTEKEVQVGTVVKRTDEDTVAAFDGTGLPIGVAGYKQVEGQSRIAVNINGLGIGVLLANPAEEITVGTQVYVTKEGKVTGIDKDNTALRAIFASKKGDGVNVASKTKVSGGAIRIDMF